PGRPAAGPDPAPDGGERPGVAGGGGVHERLPAYPAGRPRRPPQLRPRHLDRPSLIAGRSGIVISPKSPTLRARLFGLITIFQHPDRWPAGAAPRSRSR